jgi:uncharacterized repeat protein (TIGR03843 family)
VPTDERPPAADALTHLLEGEIELQGRMPWSSNSTFLASVCLDGDTMQAIYKPHRGERPLWDFPDGLYRREVAAYVLSETLGWQLVPETVLRQDAPFGAGSLQRFVDADFEQHYFTMLEDRPETHDAFRAMAAFDLVANNADRKSGHCLITDDGHIWGIDHGLCFHVEPKLRTVIWDFAGESIPAHLLDDLDRLAGNVPASFDVLLSPSEREALAKRAAAVLRSGRYPAPGSSRPYPWPLV